MNATNNFLYLNTYSAATAHSQNPEVSKVRCGGFLHEEHHRQIRDCAVAEGMAKGKFGFL